MLNYMNYVYNIWPMLNLIHLFICDYRLPYTIYSSIEISYVYNLYLV